MSDINDDKGLEDQASPSERAEADSLATQIDDLLAGKGIPAAVEAGQRELLELSSIIRSAHNEVPLDATRQTSLIEAAMAQALNLAPDENKFSAKDGPSEISSLDKARERRRRSVALVLGTLVVAAAITLLWVRSKTPSDTAGTPVATVEVHQVKEVLPTAEQSRTGDRVVGRIDRAQSGQAGDRLDQIYGDRMGGFRSLKYRRLVGKQ